MDFIMVLFLVGFPVLIIALVVWDRGCRRERLGEVWSQLAAHTGLAFNGVDLDLGGSSQSPGLSGLYRGRQVSVSKDVEYHDAYEGGIPVAYTRMRLSVKSHSGCCLKFGGRSFLARIFGANRASSGSSEFDRRYLVSGAPAAFLGRAFQLLVTGAGLFEKPDGLIMRTDDALSWVLWSSPSILLDGYELTCTQSGVPTDIPHQVALLNLLCDLAELAEQA